MQIVLFAENTDWVGNPDVYWKKPCGHNSPKSVQIIRALRKAGFSPAPDRGKGSHLAFYKRDREEFLKLL